MTTELNLLIALYLCNVTTTGTKQIYHHLAKKTITLILIRDNPLMLLDFTFA